MDAPVANWRRILLWSSETQRVVLTEESVIRTEMVQAQVEREAARHSSSHEEFLESLDLGVTCFTVRSPDDKKYERCFELLNKTNQFNTTGRRWSPNEIQAWLGNGRYLVGAEVKDRYTAYGVVGVVLVSENYIEQFALSCRVFGMDVEIAIVARTVEAMRQSVDSEIVAKLVPTEKNKLCLSVYKSCGFNDGGNGLWRIDTTRHVVVPPHIRAGPLRAAASTYRPEWFREQVQFATGASAGSVN